MTIRLNKLLAQRGLGARRKCDALIQSGAVRVNGEVVKEPGTQVEPERDRVVVNGRPLPGASQHRYYMLHKPVGIITTLQDPEGRRTIRDFLPQGGRVYPVGRLDADTSGLLLLTNDGELAHHLMHPRYGVQKRYRVRVAGEPDTRQLEQLRNGVVFEDGIRSQPADVRVLRHDRDTSLISVTIHEGRYRQVRRMCEAVGLEVRGLHRSGYGPLSLGLLERGLWRELSDEEVAKLRAVSARPMARRNTYGGGVPRGPRAGGPPRSRDDARPREREAPRPSGAGARARDESRGPKRFPGEPARGRFDRDRGPARRGARPLPGESRPASGERRTFDRERPTGRAGRPVPRERPAGREGRPFDRERPAGRGSRPFDRERPAGRESRPFDRERPAGREGRPFDRERPAGRAGRPFQGERPAGRGSRPVERGRPARAGRSFDRERPAFDRGRGPTSGGRREGRGPDRDRPFDRYRRPSERPRRPSTRDGRPGAVAPSVGRPPGRGQRAPAMPGQRPARSGPFGRSTGFERGGRPAAGGGVRGQRPPGPRGRFERGPRPRPGNAPPRPGRGRTSPPRSPGGGRRPRGPGR